MSSLVSPRSLVAPHFSFWPSSLVSHMMKSTASFGWAAVDGTASALPPPNVTGACPPASLDGGGATRQSVFGSLLCSPRIRFELVLIAAHLREIMSWSVLSPVSSSVFIHCFCDHSDRNL